MLMAMSSFGQTYFVSLYGQDFREAFGLTDGGLGGLYAIGTGDERHHADLGRTAD